jgi:hypothetical protein
LDFLSVGAQTPKPLRASEVLALETGDAMQENVAHQRCRHFAGGGARATYVFSVLHFSLTELG